MLDLAEELAEALSARITEARQLSIHAQPEPTPRRPWYHRLRDWLGV